MTSSRPSRSHLLVANAIQFLHSHWRAVWWLGLLMVPTTLLTALTPQGETGLQHFARFALTMILAVATQFIAFLLAAGGEAAVLRAEFPEEGLVQDSWRDVIPRLGRLWQLTMSYVGKFVVAWGCMIGLCAGGIGPFIWLLHTTSKHGSILIPGLVVACVTVPSFLYGMWLVVRVAINMYLAAPFVTRGHRVEDAIAQSTALGKARLWQLVGCTIWLSLPALAKLSWMLFRWLRTDGAFEMLLHPESWRAGAAFSWSTFILLLVVTPINALLPAMLVRDAGPILPPDFQVRREPHAAIADETDITRLSA